VANLAVRRVSGAPVAELTLAGKKHLTVAGPTRVITSASGAILSLLGTEPLASSVTLTWPAGRVLRRQVLPDELVALPQGQE
jgi:hypothetical protein